MAKKAWQFTIFGLNAFLDAIEIPKPKKTFGRMNTLIDSRNP